MGLFHRINDILAANLNDLVDRFENPEKMLRQALREMEASTAEASSAAARSIAAEKLLAKELAAQREQAALWQSRAASAVAAGDDEAARRALVRRRENDHLAVALADELIAAQALNARLRRQIDALRAKQSETSRKLAALSARHRLAAARRQLFRGARSSTEPIARFARMCRRVELAEVEADALAELELEGNDEWTALESRHDAAAVESELAELKRAAVP